MAYAGRAVDWSSTGGRLIAHSSTASGITAVTTPVSAQLYDVRAQPRERERLRARAAVRTADRAEIQPLRRARAHLLRRHHRHMRCHSPRSRVFTLRVGVSSRRAVLSQHTSMCVCAWVCEKGAPVTSAAQGRGGEPTEPKRNGRARASCSNTGAAPGWHATGHCNIVGRA
jgi:hypothetical protein